jgi:hypothetical protein
MEEEEVSMVVEVASDRLIPTKEVHLKLVEEEDQEERKVMGVKKASAGKALDHSIQVPTRKGQQTPG